MPYSPEHKAETRARIVESARVMFNRHGFEQVSIDDIMREAGLTRGGFYHHFPSKDAIYAEAVHSFSSCNPFVLETAARKGPPESAQKLARRLVSTYLSEGVLDDVDLQCPLYALPSDVARAGLKPRAAYTTLIQNMREVFRRALAGRRDADDAALRIVNLCVGGMVLARTTDDPELRRSLRTSARREALRLLEG